MGFPCHFFILLSLFAQTAGLRLPEGGGWRQQAVVPSDTSCLAVPDRWAIPESIQLINGRDTLRFNRGFSLSDSLPYRLNLNRGKFFRGDTVILRYQSASVTDRLSFRYYEPSQRNTNDSLNAGLAKKAVYSRRTTPREGWGGLKRRGSLTRGVMFGQGTGGSTSGLHLELSGEPSRGIFVDAVVDDRDIAAAQGGGSATLSDLDRLLFRIKTPRFTTELGDWDLSWESGRFGSVERRLKGGRASTRYRRFGAEIAAAGGDNSYHILRLRGRAGDLGPYELTDRFGGSGISVATGSERVFLDGETLERGRRKDYIIDYQLGQITFNPNRIIRDDSRIEVEYEYNENGYPRYFYASRLHLNDSGGNGFSAVLTTGIEGRDGDRPLAFEWSDEWWALAGEAGDSELGATVPGIDSVGIGKGDYVWSEGSDMSIVEFTKPDSNGVPTGYLSVEFTSDANGSYRRYYDESLLTYYYTWTGEGDGGWSPVRRIPLPDRTRQAHIIADYRDESWEINSEATMTDYDRNTLSTLDDGDNLGSAILTEAIWKPASIKGATVSTQVVHRSAGFHPLSRETEVDYGYRWNMPDSLLDEQNSILTRIRYPVHDRAIIGGFAGYLTLGAGRSSRRLGTSGEWWTDWATLGGNFERTNTNLPTVNSERDRMEVRAFRANGVFRPKYNFQIERVSQDRGNSTSEWRYAEHEAIVEFALNDDDLFTLNMSYRSDDSLTDGLHNPQSISRTLGAGYRGSQPGIGRWFGELQRFWRDFSSADAPTEYATSATLEFYWKPRNASWRVDLDYRLTSGSSRANAWIASYIGEGGGGYRREGDRYVPDPDGDISVRQIPTDTLQNVHQTMLTGRIAWQPRNDPGGGSIYIPNGAQSRIDLTLTTAAGDAIDSYLLLPDAFRSSRALTSSASFLQDVDFQRGNSAGDGRLTFRFDERRDRWRGAGEAIHANSVSYRQRRRLSDRIGIRLQPRWSMNRRWSISQGRQEANVAETGGDVELTYTTAGVVTGYGIVFGYGIRRDAVSHTGAIERRWQPEARWGFGRNGSIRFDGDWIILSSEVGDPGYDLDRGNEVGHNLSLGITIDYAIGEHLKLTAYYRNRWRGERAPRQDGLVEFTATL